MSRLDVLISNMHTRVIRDWHIQQQQNSMKKFTLFQE